MASKFWILLASLLALGFVGKSVDAIKCYQCEDCPGEEVDDDTENEECKKVDFAENLVALALKMSGQEEMMKKAGMTEEKVLESLSKQDPAVAKMIKDAQSGKPASCFTLEVDKKNLMYRGCGPDVPAGCKPAGDMEICICKEDGCNGDVDESEHTDTTDGSKSLTPVLLVVCFSVLISWLKV